MIHGQIYGDRLLPNHIRLRELPPLGNMAVSPIRGLHQPYPRSDSADLAFRPVDRLHHTLASLVQ